MGKRVPGNARNRVEAVTARPRRTHQPTLLQRVQVLETEREVATAARRELWRIVRALQARADKDREEALQQLAAALERIGVLEQTFVDMFKGDPEVVAAHEAVMKAEHAHGVAVAHALGVLQSALGNVGMWAGLDFFATDFEGHVRETRARVAEQVAASSMSAVNLAHHPETGAVLAEESYDTKPRRFARLRRWMAHPLTPLLLALTLMGLVAVVAWPVLRLAFLR